MTTQTHPERTSAPRREDARGLIARLCRELGVAAVADALNAPGAQPQSLLQLPTESRYLAAQRDRLAA